MNKVANLFICCLLSLSFGIAAPASHQEGSNEQSSKRSYPQHLNLPAAALRDLKQGRLDQEQFNIEGYVRSVYQCPPCPKGAQCKPCLGDHIIIAESKNDQKSPSDPEDHLLIFATNPAQFKTGKRYLFSVKFRGRIKEGAKIEQVELIGYDALEDSEKR